MILFEGGLNLEIRRLRREQTPIRRLVTGGALLTLGAAALAARYFLGWDWMVALVFGSLVVVTGPTVVGPLVRDLRLRTRVATVLEAEGVLIDPVGAILAVLMLEVALTPGASSLAGGAMVLVQRAGLGTVAGIAGGFALALVLRSRRFVPEGLENIFVLASALLLFQGCEQIFSQSGLLAVTVAGVVVGNLRSPTDRDLREFKDQLTVMLIGMLFVLLAAAVRLEDVRDLGLAGLLVVAALVFVVRPAVVWLATVGSDLAWRERLLIAWIAPRGIVAAAMASAAALALERALMGGAAELLALVFLVIACTVTLAGLTAGPVASLLRQRLPSRDGVLILGAHGLGLLLAEELRSGDVPVVFIDSNAESCRRAEEAGFPRDLRQRAPGADAPARAARGRRDGGRTHSQPDAEQRLREPQPRALPRAQGLRRSRIPRKRSRPRAGARDGRRGALRRAPRRRALGRAQPSRWHPGGALGLPRRSGRGRRAAGLGRHLRHPDRAPRNGCPADARWLRLQGG